MSNDEPTKFTARVLLRRATPDDYLRLNEEMERRGFHRVIAGERGLYRLPSGDYWCEPAMPLAIEEVHALVDEAARASHGDHCTLVAHVAAIAWGGLDTLSPGEYLAIKNRAARLRLEHARALALRRGLIV